MPPRLPSRRFARTLPAGALVLGIGVIGWPARDPTVPEAPVAARPFTWERDSLWNALEASFALRRAGGCMTADPASRDMASLDAALIELGAQRRVAADPLFDSLEHAFFELGTRVASCGELGDEYVALQGRMRDAVKRQSTTWDLSSRDARDRLYRALYGSRAAVEEVMLQQDGITPLYVGPDVPSATPSAMSNGVRLHSGDILVSRGGYPTSALIARGNDYPGNFSHIALVHVDSTTRAISVVEAHIERGVVVATADDYLADRKLRVMVLRLRADLPALQPDPMLPHRAATAMLERARSEHIPYDFAMHYDDSARMFCSEVASTAYRDNGITLWTGISTISAPGLRRWLASFGVQAFETQEPSDLEYDPQLSVVAEWRDPESLYDDHIDNAVTDAMLEGAERGDLLTFEWYTLPVARLLKGYSWLRQLAGGMGPIPEGMSPSAALRNRSYGALHSLHESTVRISSEEWHAEHGYRPAYWTLVQLAREAVAR